MILKNTFGIKGLTLIMAWAFYFLLITSSFGQYFQGFEASCDDYSYSFENGCIEDWFPGNGTPDTRSNFTGINGYNGSDRYAHLYVKRGDCGNGPSTWAYKNKGESIVFNHEFTEGVEYRIRYAIRFGGASTTWRTDIILSNNINFQAGASLDCESGYDFVQEVPQGSQIVNSHIWNGGNAPSSDWLEIDTIFTPNSTFTQFWVRPIWNLEGNNLDGQSSSVYFDAFEIVCGETEAPDFIFTDSQGNPKDNFCFGEDIFIQVEDVNYFYNNISFDIWENFNNPGSYYSLGWNAKSQNNVYNLSQILRDLGGGAIDPLGIYSLKLSVNHPDCDLITRIHGFKYICCEAVDAELVCEINSTTDHVKFSADASTDYTLYGGSHEICIYTDLDEDGVFELVLCTSNPSIEAYLDKDTRYYITHEVTTLCGTECITKDFCSGNCPSVTPIENCSTIANPSCETPVLHCPTKDKYGSATILEWNNLNANHYVVEIITNDPDCGCKGVISSQIFSTLAFTAPINVSVNTCYSYRVRSICENNISSPWSPKKCMDECKIDQKPDDLGGTGTGRNQINDSIDKAQITSYPSPFGNYVNINATGMQSEFINLRIVDFMGRVVRMERLKPISNAVKFTWEAESSLSSGLYLIQILDGNKVFTQKVIRN